MNDHFNQEVLNFIVCPRCKGEVRVSEDGTGLICDSCCLLYDIKDGIPVMIEEEAHCLDDRRGVRPAPDRVSE
ncbi:MAG TPA: Trm112 family protein [Thermodesulfobacteriaceae bacterium]|nr:Trm112 family protein [Thermodesulfobacteriaceae bacterium]